jgi:hypothetical protein
MSFQIIQFSINTAEDFPKNCAIWRLSEHALSTTCILESTLHAAQFLQFQAFLGIAPIEEETEFENCLLSKNLQ